MKRASLLLARVAAGIFILVALLWYLGPYEDSDLSVRFDPARFDEGVEAYFNSAEAQFDDITPGTQKRVIWADAPRARTDWVVVYVHGFSATSEEIRPVPDRIAENLGANLIYTRLQGHGRGGDALATGTVQGWMMDVAEALAAAREVGDRVLVISTSTGGTLMAAAAQDPAMIEDVAGIVFVSPNFGINNPLAPLLTWPAARHWLPMLAGDRRSFPPRNEAQARYWTTEYPSVAAMPLAALVQAVWRLDPARAQVPALFWYSDKDMVVRPDLTADVAARWGGPVTVVHPQLGAGDDGFAHVIAGDVLSPGQTDAVVAGVTDWLGALR